MRHLLRHAVLLLVLGALAAPGCRDSEVTVRPLNLNGPAIAYSGYRDGQSPKTGVLPSQDQVAEDLRILAKNWRLIRVYAADRHGEDVLEVIRREGIDLEVMLGIWLDREPGFEQENALQISEGIRLANAYEDLVVAVNVGNEVLIEWTEHPVEEEQVIRYVRQVREAVKQPVTVADNYVWWRDDGTTLAREVDFITMHTYPLWERRDIDEGLSFTIENYDEVRAAHPGKTVVIGEAGWATYTEGNLHVPRGGDEVKQKRYYEELMQWSRDAGVPVFLFEAFDEPWKGTGTEGHWGLFTVDREAKPVMQALYPELAPDGPTSPRYPEQIEASGPDVAVVLSSDLAATLSSASVNPLGPGLSSSGVATDESAEGGRALRLVFTGESWAGMYIILGEHDASAADSVSMRVKLPDDVAELELKLEDANANGRSVNTIEHVTGRRVDGWMTIRVPMAEFAGIDLSRLSKLGLWNPSNRSGVFVACELTLDEVRFD